MVYDSHVHGAIVLGKALSSLWFPTSLLRADGFVDLLDNECHIPAVQCHRREGTDFGNYLGIKSNAC